MLRATLLASLLLATACSQAYSDRRAAPAGPMVVAGSEQAPVAAPYGFEVLDEHGRSLETFEKGGRYYVLGDSGDRYLIHITNPTDRRVEAVVTVDGLDVIDGEPGDLAKRGYVIQPHGDLSIEGFRTSTSDVATFRFSSVSQSYAGKKGKARNVGVIAVAIFDEVAPQELILEPAPNYDPPPVVYYDEESIKGYDRGDSAGEASGSGGGYGRDSAAKRAPSSTDAPTSGAVAPDTVMRPPPPPDDDRYVMEEEKPDPRCCDQDKGRPGLGTEFGERRHSAATWTRFERASQTPTAVAELRYNDAAGLASMGIDISLPAHDPAEVTKRETADPFPGDPNFSRPPAGVY